MEARTAASGPSPTGRLLRMRGYLPDTSRINPYRWARARFGRDEDDLDDLDDELPMGYQHNGGLAAPMAAAAHAQVPLKAGSAGTNATLARLRRADGRGLIIEGQRHPIPALMRRARKRWRRLNVRQSKTFAQAVAEYRRRYGRAPPKGFDRWCVRLARSRSDEKGTPSRARTVSA